MAFIIGAASERMGRASTAGGAAAARARTPARGRPFPRPMWLRPSCRREGRHLAPAAAGALRRARRGDLPRQQRQVRQGNRRRGQGRLRRLGRHPPADRRVGQHRRRPRHHPRLGGRSAHLCRQGDRALRRGRVPRQEVRRMDVPRREVRQEGQDQQLDRPADGRLGRTARLSRVGPQGSRPRQGPDRSCRPAQGLPGSQEDQQAGGLRARQCGGRRQRLRQLDAVEPWWRVGR